MCTDATDGENQQIDDEIVDRERAAALAQMANRVIDDLDWTRRTEVLDAEADIERQLLALERECHGGS